MWTKHFTFVGKNERLNKSLKQGTDSGWYGSSEGKSAGTSKYSSYLPEYYAGNPQRLERYKSYDNMDMDSEVNSSLDVISDFSTQTEEHNDTPFNLEFIGEVSETEVQILNSALRQWSKLNEFNKRIWGIFRSVIKYGDCFFIRDPETFEWLWVDQAKVQAIVVNSAKGKIPEEYIINGIDFKIDPQIITDMAKLSNAVSQSAPSAAGTPVATQSTAYSGSNNGIGETVGVKASSIVHLSLSQGMDGNWPFGNSILESVFKVYKQKELLEDSIIIYRVQRAPERRIFYIDVGEMNTHKAMAFVERIKNEIHQKRIPNRAGGGSNILDAAYNPLCLALDTRIPLLDGRTLPLTELIAEYQAGKENWVYSVDPDTGKVKPGNITWAGITRKQTQVIRLTLDSGETLTVTPDHKIPVWGKGFVEAQHLTPEDSLFSFETRKKSLSTVDRDYTQVWDHETKGWIFTHRLVGEFFRSIGKHQEFTYSEENIGKVKTVIHHKDYDRYNNDPRNLQWMNKQDHIAYHSEQKKHFWANAPEAELQRIKDKISNTLKDNFAALPENEKEDIRNLARTAQAIFVEKRNTDPEFAKALGEKQGALRSQKIKDDPKFKAQVVANLSTWQENMPNQQKVYTFAMLQRLNELGKTYDFKLKTIVAKAKHDSILLNEIRTNNPVKPGQQFKIQTNEVTQQVIYNTVRHFGYQNWKAFKAASDQFNHRIVDIEWLVTPQDTGTITVDGKERWHAHHTFAVEAGIFVKNSMIEDYFFAQTPDGRGSKVETLPGGDNLGEIDDLKYFDNKLKRGLGVPSSYLPSGPEDGGTPYSDGKVGTAYMQEYRFAQYCKRLQMLIADKFDREFKLYLKKRDFNIDAALFEVRLCEPQSFSKYRQIEIDSAQINIFQPLSEVPYLSKRFLLQRYLNLDEDEILENEKLWKEENKNKVKKSDDGMGGMGGAMGGDIGLDSVGVRPPVDFEDDFGGGEEGGEDAGGEDLNSSPVGGTATAPETPTET